MNFKELTKFYLNEGACEKSGISTKNKLSGKLTPEERELMKYAIEEKKKKNVASRGKMPEDFGATPEEIAMLRKVKPSLNSNCKKKDDLRATILTAKVEKISRDEARKRIAKIVGEKEANRLIYDFEIAKKSMSDKSAVKKVLGEEVISEGLKLTEKQKAKIASILLGLTIAGTIGTAGYTANEIKKVIDATKNSKVEQEVKKSPITIKVVEFDPDATIRNYKNNAEVLLKEINKYKERMKIIKDSEDSKIIQEYKAREEGLKKLQKAYEETVANKNAEQEGKKQALDRLKKSGFDY